MKHRLVAWVVFASASVSMLSVTATSASGQVTTGHVEGRITVDGKPVPSTRLTLVGTTKAKKTFLGRTEAEGRFQFPAVEPGSYRLKFTLYLAPAQGGSRLSCKTSGYKGKAAQATRGPSGAPLVILSLQSKEAFKVKADKTVTRNVKTDCKPDAMTVAGPSASIPPIGSP